MNVMEHNILSMEVTTTNFIIHNELGLRMKALLVMASQHFI